MSLNPEKVELPHAIDLRSEVIRAEPFAQLSPTVRGIIEIVSPWIESYRDKLSGAWLLIDEASDPQRPRGYLVTQQVEVRLDCDFEDAVSEVDIQIAHKFTHAMIDVMNLPAGIDAQDFMRWRINHENQKLLD